WFCCSRIARQRLVRSLRQCSPSRHWGEKSVTTWSPGATEVASSPTRSTMPAPSWPSTVGKYPDGSAPEAVYRSLWQTPPATTRRGARPLDDARALVAEHRREIPGWIGARGRVQIVVADAARDEPDERLARLRL